MQARTSLLFRNGLTLAICAFFLTIMHTSASPASPCGLLHDLNSNGVVDVKDLKIALISWHSNSGGLYATMPGIMQLATDMNIARCAASTFPMGVVLFEQDRIQGGAAYAHNSGARYVRWWLEWNWIEHNAPVNGIHSYYWNTLDANLQELMANGLTVILTIDNVPSWASRVPPSSSCGPMDDQQLQNFADLVAAAAARYDLNGVNDGPTTVPIRYFELFNEADNADQSQSSIGGCWGKYGSKYADMLKVVYPRVKAVSPLSQIIFSSMAHDLFYNPPPGYVWGGCSSPIPNPTTACPFNYDFLKDAISRLAADPAAAANNYFFDYMGFHNYNFSRLFYNGPLPLDQSLLGKVKYMHNRMGAIVPALANKPFASTEIGLRVADAGARPAEEDQARHAIQEIVHSMAARLPFSLWYNIKDRPGELRYGLFRGGTGFAGLERPSYFALQLAASKLDGWDYDTQIIASDVNIQAFAFKHAGQTGRRIVAWWDDGKRMVDQSQTASATLRVGLAELGAWNGKVLVTNRQANALNTILTQQLTGSSAVDVSFTSNPVFIEVAP